MTEHSKTTQAFNAAANPPRKTHAERRIEELNAKRPEPAVEQHLTIGGTVEQETYTAQQAKLNEAIDREVAFWEKQITPQRNLKDKARENFQRTAEGRSR